MTKNTKYISEATEFINGYIKNHPEVKTKQQSLRKTWWDHDGIDQEEQKEYKESKVQLNEYAYFSYPSKHKS